MKTPNSVFRFVTFALLGCLNLSPVRAEKPNIVLIFADDLGWQEPAYAGSDCRISTVWPQTAWFFDTLMPRQETANPAGHACSYETDVRPVGAGDFFATICRALDIDHENTYEATGRPVPYAAMGSKPIGELF